MKKENCFNFGKKISASIVAAALVFSTATVLPSFAAKETTEVFAKGCVPDSAKVIEEHLEDEQETYNLDFIESSDEKTKDVLVNICKAAMVSSYPSKVDISNEFPKPD